MVVFALAPLFKLSGLISPLISSSILGIYQPGEFIFQCPIFLPFHTVHGVLNTEVICHSLLQWTTFCQTTPPWPVHLGQPHTAWLSFIELDKGWSMWSDWLVVCDCGFSLSALWCPLSAPTVLLGFLLPWTWGLSSQLFQQSAATAPDLGHGVSPDDLCSWIWTWGMSSWLPLMTLQLGYLLSAAPVRCRHHWGLTTVDLIDHT